MRIVSLLPAATELLYAVGVQPVGVSHGCDFPPQARDLPAVTRTRIDPDASSSDIDEQVQSAVDGDGVYELDRNTLCELDPDYVITQGTCEVCAVDDSVVRGAIRDLQLETELVTFDPHSIDDVLASLSRLGVRFDCADRARTVRDRLASRIEHVSAATPDDGPRVVVLDWLDPVMVAGHWIPGMVDRVGGDYGLAEPGQPSRPRPWETIREYDPEVLTAAPCGFGVDQTLENSADLVTLPGWSDLTAVREEQVYCLDGHHYVNRPGPRLVETLAALANAIHPGTVGPPPHSAEPFPSARP